MAPKPVKALKVKLFADGAERAGILKMYEDPLIRGFTTNPTLMRKAGITDYEAFAKDILSAVPDRPISFEVFADEFHEMERQALKISRWGENVYTKIPVTNTRRESSLDLIRRLARQGVKLNVTAMMTLDQVQRCECGARRRPSRLCVGICRQDRRHWARSRSHHGRCRRVIASLLEH